MPIRRQTIFAFKRLPDWQSAGRAFAHNVRSSETQNSVERPECPNLLLVGDWLDGIQEVAMARVSPYSDPKEPVMVQLSLGVTGDFFGSGEDSKLDTDSVFQWLLMVHAWSMRLFPWTLVSSAFHSDEGSPHAHLLLLPIRGDGILSVKGALPYAGDEGLIHDSYHRAIEALGIARDEGRGLSGDHSSGLNFAPIPSEWEESDECLEPPQKPLPRLPALKRLASTCRRLAKGMLGDPGVMAMPMRPSPTELLRRLKGEAKSIALISAMTERWAKPLPEEAIPKDATGPSMAMPLGMGPGHAKDAFDGVPQSGECVAGVYEKPGDTNGPQAAPGRGISNDPDKGFEGDEQGEGILGEKVEGQVEEKGEGQVEEKREGQMVEKWEENGKEEVEEEVEEECEEEWEEEWGEQDGDSHRITLMLRLLRSTGSAIIRGGREPWLGSEAAMGGKRLFLGPSGWVDLSDGSKGRDAIDLAAHLFGYGQGDLVPGVAIALGILGEKDMPRAFLGRVFDLAGDISPWDLAEGERLAPRLEERAWPSMRDRLSELHGIGQEALDHFHVDLVIGVDRSGNLLLRSERPPTKTNRTKTGGDGPDFAYFRCDPAQEGPLLCLSREIVPFFLRGPKGPLAIARNPMDALKAKHADQGISVMVFPLGIPWGTEGEKEAPLDKDDPMDKDCPLDKDDPMAEAILPQGTPIAFIVQENPEEASPEPRKAAWLEAVRAAVGETGEENHGDGVAVEGTGGMAEEAVIAEEGEMEEEAGMAEENESGDVANIAEKALAASGKPESRESKESMEGMEGNENTDFAESTLSAKRGTDKSETGENPKTRVGAGAGAKPPPRTG
ncbi:MAG: plasmid recombination protein [Deltaproteobacteria bacterium]|jgi:hypothetical protein|nr:plasmid recombination protein [Deltaproteobacteria bacterium]